MSYTRYRTVAFGSGKGGLATVGYTLQGGSRITAGVAEVGPSTGIYGATIAFPDAFTGSILWDTGGGSPVYAAGAINPGDDEYVDAKVTSRSTFGGGSIVVDSVTGPVTLDLTQPLTDVKTATVGGALHGSWSVAFGKMVRDSLNKVLLLFGMGSQSVPLVTFDLDSGLDPSTRTPR